MLVISNIVSRIAQLNLHVRGSITGPIAIVYRLGLQRLL